MKLLMIFIFFLLLGVFFIIANENIHLNNSKERDKFFEKYENWIDGLIGNSKSVTGYLVKMEWLPGEHE